MPDLVTVVKSGLKSPHVDLRLALIGSGETWFSPRTAKGRWNGASGVK